MNDAQNIAALPMCLTCGGAVTWNEAKSEWWHAAPTPSEGNPEHGA